jgi:hypothetical protein
MKLLIVIVSSLWIAVLMAYGAQRIPIDVSKLGPQVGQRIPDFSLTDQHGKMWTQQSIMGPRGAMLVFYRSADW